MGVIVAHHVAGDLGRFPEASGGRELQLAHRIKDTAVHRLQPVARIRQRTVHDRAQRIGQIAIANRAPQRFRHVLRGKLVIINQISHGFVITFAAATVKRMHPTIR